MRELLIARDIQLQILRGLAAELPSLGDGEFYLATDTGYVYVGLGGINLEVAKLATQIQDGTVPTQLAKVDANGNQYVIISDGSMVGIYNATLPILANGHTQSAQLDAFGNIFVNRFRRSQLKSVTGSIASTTAATILPAQGVGIYSDLLSLILTLSAETAAAYITVNVSDGTNTYRFGIASQAVGTAGAGTGSLVINFSVPLPATNANTAWSIALSVADATIQYTAMFVQQGQV